MDRLQIILCAVVAVGVGLVVGAFSLIAGIGAALVVAGASGLVLSVAHELKGGEDAR